MAQNPISATIAANLFGSPKTQKQLAVDPSGFALVAQGVAPLYEASYNATQFTAANPSGVTTSAALATTYVGICLSNPIANTKNLAVLRVHAHLVVEPAALLGVGVIAGSSAAGITVHTTPITTLANAKIGGAAPVGLVDSACTLVGTPYWADWLGSATTATTGPFVREYNGELIIPPGGYIAIGTSAAGPASGFLGSIHWLELPV